MEKINLEDILAKHSKNYKTAQTMGRNRLAVISGESAKAAMTELWNLCVDKCKQEFLINQLEYWGHRTGETEIDEQSIESVKTMIL